MKKTLVKKSFKNSSFSTNKIVLNTVFPTSLKTAVISNICVSLQDKLEFINTKSQIQKKNYETIEAYRPENQGDP